MRLRSLLRGSCFGTVVPWGLASFYRICGGGAGPGLPGPARLGSSLLQSWCLGLGPGCLVCRLPSVSLPWVGSTGGFGFGLHFFGNGLPVLSRNSGRSFLGNLSLRLRLRLIPSLPRAPCIFMPGLCRKRGWECWSGSSSTSLQHGSQVGHTGSPSLLCLNLLFILQVSILSEQMVFCVS